MRLGPFPIFYYTYMSLCHDALLFLMAECDEFSCAFKISFVEGGVGQESFPCLVALKTVRSYKIRPPSGMISESLLHE